jgi:type II secretory pathway pseudopilin PulG
MADNKQSQSGFALLVSLIVVSVVVSIGLALLDVTIKQLRLSSNSTDSEIAFHAANAGIECSQYWRRKLADTIEGDQFALPTAVPPGGSIAGSLNCFGVNDDNSEYATISVPISGAGDAVLYQYEFSWAGGNRCSEVDMLVVTTDVFGTIDAQIDYSDISAIGVLPGYPTGQDLNCQIGSFCTVISSKGYNKSCAQKNSFGTVQREVLLEL